MAHNNDIFAMLDQASIFTCGKPPRKDVISETSKKTKQKIEKHNKRANNKSVEEKAYAELIGFEASDNSDDDYMFEDFERFDDETVEDTLSKALLNRQLNNNNSGTVNKKRNVFSLGRGRILNNYENLFPSSRNGIKSQVMPHRNRQEQIDRLIGGQLREVVGAGTSNQEIEDAFAKKFAKNSAEDAALRKLDEERNHKRDYDLSSTASSDSKRSSKSSKHSGRQVYVPPPLRCANTYGETSAEPKESTEGEDNSFGPKVYKPLSPIKIGRSEIKVTASKVACIYDGFAGSDEQDDKENCNDSSSDKDVEIVSEVKNSSEEKQKLGFKIKDKENSGNLSRFKGGRNALINGLLKRNQELGKPVEDNNVKKKEDNLNSNLCDVRKKSSGDFISDRFSPLPDNKIKCDYSPFVSDKFEWPVNDDDSSTDRCSSVISSASPSRFSDVSSNTNNSTIFSNSPKNTFSTVVDKSLENKQKPLNMWGDMSYKPVTNSSANFRKQRNTLGDYLTTDSLNSSSSSLGINSLLNPEAPLFTPNYTRSGGQISYDFKLNDVNFPPL